VILFLQTVVLKDEFSAKRLWHILKAWKEYADQKQPLEIIITVWKAKRRPVQNRKYWACLNELAESAWLDGKQYSADVWHEHFKRTFIGCEEMPDGSQVGISTTTLSVSDFADYLNRIMAYAVSELGVELT
jgi:hypothetical protein